jgi:hypothetical protein
VSGPCVGDTRQLTRCRHGQRGRRDIIRDAKRFNRCGARQVIGFYQDTDRETSTVYVVGGNCLINEDRL